MIETVATKLAVTLTAPDGIENAHGLDEDPPVHEAPVTVQPVNA